MDNAQFIAAVVRGVCKLQFPAAVETILKSIILGWTVGTMSGLLF